MMKMDNVGLGQILILERRKTYLWIEIMSLILDDITAWDKLPRSRWMLNKLYVQQRLGNVCGAVGIEPLEYPVWVKPVINVHGLGIGSRKVQSRHLMNYEPGMMWMPFYEGDHISYDIKWEAGEPMEVYAAKGLNGPNFTEWQVDRIEPNEKLKSLVYKLSNLGDLPSRFNIETIGDNLIECHPRWSAEFINYYDKCPFTQKVLWSKDINDKLPESWIDCRDDPCNQWTGEYKRIAYTYQLKEK